MSNQQAEEKRTQIAGLTGEMALAAMSKNQKKKYLADQRAKEEEERLHRENILKAKQDWKTQE